MMLTQALVTALKEKSNSNIDSIKLELSGKNRLRLTIRIGKYKSGRYLIDQNITFTDLLDRISTMADEVLLFIERCKDMKV